MKSILILLLSAIIGQTAFAQSNQEDVDMIQALYGKQKKELVAGFIMPADSAGKAAFWQLYDQYEADRKALGKDRIALLEKYASAYHSLDDAGTDKIMKETQALQGQVDDLLLSYYGKIKKSVGVKQAAQFYQLESYLLSMTRVYILSNIPFIGAMELEALGGTGK